MPTFLKRRITKDQNRDTGMAIVLLLLIVAASRKQDGVLLVAAALQVLNMLVPQIFWPVALVWLGLSELVGAVVPRAVLGIVFFAIVTPIAFVRRLFGKDSLKLRAFRTGKGSVMLERRHLFTSRDLERPY